MISYLAHTSFFAPGQIQFSGVDKSCVICIGADLIMVFCKYKVCRDWDTGESE